MTAILESITDGVAIYDRDWRITFINQRGAQLAGQSTTDLLGKPIWEVYPEALKTEFYQKLQSVFETGDSTRFQIFYEPLNVWLGVRAYPLPIGMLVLYEDITEWKQAEVALNARLQQTHTQLEQQTSRRRRAEEALRATNEELAEIFESITDGFCAIDGQWRFTYINQRAERILERHQSELLGRNVWEVYPHVVNTRLYYHCDRTARSRVSTQFEYECSTLNRWFQINLYPARDGIAAYFQDITSRKQIERICDQLLQQEQMARRRAELANQRCAFLSEASNILASSLDYETTLSNVARLTVPVLADFCLIHKLEVDGVLKQVAAVHRHPDKQALVDELSHLYQTSMQTPDNLLARALQTSGPVLVTDPLTLHPISQDPRVIRISVELAPRALIIVPLIARGQKLGTMVLAIAESDRDYDPLDLSVATDLSQRAAMAIDNARLYQQLQESNRLKDEFLTTLSHELRTPLHTIVGWTQMLRLRSFNARTLDQALDAIERKAKALTQIVYDLLTISRVITGQFRLKPSFLWLSSIVQETAESLKLAMDAKDLHLSLNLDPTVGPVRGDLRYLRQVVWNLLSNAMKFTPRHGQITIYLQQIHDRVQLQIQDTGQGITPEFLPHVFEPFRQADGSSTRSGQGLGLGLTLVRHLVELHGGTIAAVSDGEGQGATFTVEIPLAKIHADANPLMNHHRNGPLDSNPDPSLGNVLDPITDSMIELCPLHNLQVLLIDAKFHSRDPLAVQMENDGAEVIAVASVSDAAGLVEHFSPDVLLINITTLTERDMEVIARVKALSTAEGRPLPLIALTTKSSEDERLQALSMGFQVYLSKHVHPVEFATVVAAIARTQA
jgi:PAS domain S-box-containing protein